MASFQHILFPVDFSERNSQIAPHVACMARQSKARVTLLHVIEIPTGAYPGWPEYAVEINIPAMKAERAERLESFLKSEFEGIPTARVVLEGSPTWRIIEYAEKENVDLVMLPTHGYGPFRRFLLGSVAAKLLHDVKCPIWTSAHSPETVAPPAGYHKILCGLDLATGSIAVLQWASRFAAEQGATLKLAHAIPAASLPGSLEPEGGRFRAFLFDAARAELLRLQKEAGTAHDVIVEGGDIPHVIAETAKNERADLVVIGRGVMQEALGRMRTNVYSIIREAPCPVISI